ncbi:hypothetical protein RRU94_15655 [Domibacillus sp. DTU_2020_1001157_1_SI_ALB_TIR_016]|uniref:hypothetical protein n=1 Tax=Domibacillus sp. DTU_2020_1001157_1_SI_ALB_TIR_016 TaxID=3077789 RepID=UPI0028E73512|nr:hypothetical protein [Domibacillus sp. DTU_2020_1001157_1_SI_ALB_TIR_016]WNS82183.1 hypothetical protein RRU94_15655 [Domibacillus sp. DTU_2020_1001157_1_SI_ALB_TIR_016]
MNGKTYRKTPIEAMQQRILHRKELIDKVRTQMPPLIKDDKNFISGSEQKTDQKEDRAARNEEKKLKKKLSEQNELISQLKKELTKYKDVNANLKKENWETKQKVSYIETSYKDLLEKQKESLFFEQTLRKKAENELEKLRKERALNNKGMRKQLQLADQVKQLKDKNATLRHKLENYDSFTKKSTGTSKLR